MRRRAALAALAALADGRRVVCRIVARDKYRRLVGECGTGAGPSLDGATAASGLGVSGQRAR